MSRISIIIPLYKHAEYITKTLESTLFDDTSDVELLVRDDCSPDDSYNIAKEWIDRNGWRFLDAKVERNEQNLGIVGTLNALISQSNGEYIFPIASDDVFCNRYISDRMTVLANYDIAINRSYLINKEGLRICSDAAHKLFHSSKMNLSNPRLLPLEIMLRWSVVGPSLSYRRSVIEKIGLYGKDCQVEDRDFFLRAIGHNLRIAYTDNACTSYRLHAENSSRKGMRKTNTRIAVAQINLKYASLFRRHGLLFTFLSSYSCDVVLLKSGFQAIYILLKSTRYALVFLILAVVSLCELMSVFSFGKRHIVYDMLGVKVEEP